MSDYLPSVYVSFRERFPEVAGAQDNLGPRSMLPDRSTPAPAGS